MEIAAPVILAFGGGVNSTALILEMVARGERFDFVVFADTGGEKPHTYAHRDQMARWLAARGLPSIVTVQKVRKDGIDTLEQFCLTKRYLPSTAFGFPTCSAVWKRDPCHAWARAHPRISRWWQTKGNKAIRLIGFDADEPHRAIRAPKTERWYQNRYPLIEWDMGRHECLETIRAAGIDPPGKSACFFCPNSRPAETRQLRKRYPALFERGLEIERRNADRVKQEGIGTSIKGLGRNYAWADLDYVERHQLTLWDDDAIPCGCYDGE